MKNLRKLLLVATSLILFVDFNLLLKLASANAESKNPAIRLEKDSSIGKKNTNKLNANGDKLAQSSGFVNRLQSPQYLAKLVEADELLARGNIQEAKKILRGVKPDFTAPPSDMNIKDPIYEVEELEKLGGAASVYWREYQRGVEKKLGSRIFVPLQLLTKKYPEFIPGHLDLAKACEEEPKACKKNASPGSPKNTIEVLKRATEIYPGDPELIKAKVKALEKDKKYLEAAITARQFAVIYGDDPEAAEFNKLADKNWESYKNDVSTDRRVLCKISEITEKLQRDKVEKIKGCQLLKLLQKGESYLGQELSDEYQNEKKPKLVDDPKVINYVKGIAGRLTPHAYRKDFKYDYHIFEDSAVKIFSFPGGIVYISTGAIEKTNSEAQLAGLLGKEIAHSAFSHWSTNRVVKDILHRWKEVIPLGDLVTNLITFYHSQEQERQADILATKILNSVGYAADGLHNAIILQNGKLNKRNYQIQNFIKRNNYNRYAYEGVRTHQCIKNHMKGVSLDSCQSIN